MYGHWESTTRKLNRHYQSTQSKHNRLPFGAYWTSNPNISLGTPGRTYDVIMNNHNSNSIIKISNKIDMAYIAGDSSFFLVGDFKDKIGVIPKGDKLSCGYQITLLLIDKDIARQEFDTEKSNNNNDYGISTWSTFLRMVQYETLYDNVGFYADELSGSTLLTNWVNISNHNTIQKENAYKTWRFGDSTSILGNGFTDVFSHILFLGNNNNDNNGRITSSCYIRNTPEMQDIGRTVIFTKHGGYDKEYVYVVTPTLYNQLGKIINI